MTETERNKYADFVADLRRKEAVTMREALRHTRRHTHEAQRQLVLALDMVLTGIDEGRPLTGLPEALEKALESIAIITELTKEV